MTSLNRYPWRRSVAGMLAAGAMTAGLMSGFGMATALADPDESTPDAAATSTPAPAPMTADQALAIVAADYDLGAGGGQLSNLIHSVLKLRAQGFMPSAANRAAIEKALESRPNQAPLIAALEDTLAYQKKRKAQLEAMGGTPTGPLPNGVTPAPANGGGVALLPATAP